jgi:AraC-like DNA-binding protein
MPMTEIVRWLISEGKGEIAQAAPFFGMSKRTLQRRLAESGTGFSKIADEVRLARAISLVNDPSTKLSDIARELGYSDPANFDRAFRRWTGLSPTGFRSMDRKTRDDLMGRLKSALRK